MTGPNGEQLPYISSQPDFDFAPKDIAKPQDEVDAPTLVKIFQVLEARKAYYNSTEAVNFGVDLTVENQMIINKKMLGHIQELENMITSTLTKVKETQDERNR